MCATINIHFLYFEASLFRVILIYHEQSMARIRDIPDSKSYVDFIDGIY